MWALIPIIEQHNWSIGVAPANDFFSGSWSDSFISGAEAVPPSLDIDYLHATFQSIFQPLGPIDSGAVDGPVVDGLDDVDDELVL